MPKEIEEKIEDMADSIGDSVANFLEPIIREESKKNRESILKAIGNLNQSLKEVKEVLKNHEINIDV